MEDLTITLRINPEPWAIGSVSRGATTARISPNPNLVTYQNAVRAELEAMPGWTPVEWPSIHLQFFFWRQIERYIDAADRRRSGHQADVTNLQKGLEDALQGLLFKNDRDVERIESTMVAQGVDVDPGIIIVARENVPGRVLDIDPNVLANFYKIPLVPPPSDNSWPPKR